MNLSLPFSGQYPVTQNFGEHPEWYAGFGLPAHNGIDYGIPVGTPILAAADGVVIGYGNDEQGYGIYVKIDHDTHYTLYAHLSSNREVWTGRTVKAGDKIGVSGNTGNSTAPHLHFGLRRNDYPDNDPWRGWIDPEPYFVDADDPDLPEADDPAGYGRVMARNGLNVRNGAGIRYKQVSRLPYGLTIGYYGMIEDGGDIWLDLGAGMYCASVYEDDVLVEVQS